MATHKKVFSRVLAKQFLRDVKGNTLNYVEGNGFFRNRTHSTLVHQVLPGMYTDTLVQAGQHDQFLNQAHSKSVLTQPFSRRPKR